MGTTRKVIFDKFFVFYGGCPPIKHENLSKMIFLVVPRALDLHAARYRHAEQFWKGFEGWETEI